MGVIHVNFRVPVTYLEWLKLQSWGFLNRWTASSLSLEMIMVTWSIFGRPFVKWFAQCYRTDVLSCLYCLSVCLSVCDVGVLWPKGWTDEDETWDAGRPRPRPHCVRWGPSSPQKGNSPQFLAHVRCGQSWMKMPLGMEVGLSPGDFVLDGDPAPPKRGTAPNFRPMSFVAKWLDGLRCHLVCS